MIQLNDLHQQNDDDSTHTDKTTQSTRNQVAVALAGALKLLQEQQATPALPPAPGLNPGNTNNTPQNTSQTLGAIPERTSDTATTDATILPLTTDLSAQTTTTAMEVVPDPGQLIHPNPKAPAPALPPDIETGNVSQQI
jgi:hypothetical protein